MLRKARIFLACVFFIGITLLFVGIGQQWWGWMAKLQFLPSCLALNFAVIAGVLLLTILFGRIYCSVICPMGVFQDSIIWLRRKIGGKKHGFKHEHYRKPNNVIRWIMGLLLIATVIVGNQFFITFLAPYSAYGRIVRSIVGLAEGESIIMPLLLTAGTTLVVIVVFAWFWGREYCNLLCPVGAVLGEAGRHPAFGFKIDEDKCVHCGLCGKRCKASCIDTKERKIDHSRCVDCFDCIGNCKQGAISYGLLWGNGSKKASEGQAEPDDKGRRNFIATAATVTGAAVAGNSIVASAQQKHLDGGLADVIDKQVPERSERLVPFGAQSVKHFYDKCTACQLCVSACPNGVLRPSTDLEHFLQPQMGYEKGYCRPECTACSDVCPAGAILPIKKEEKLITHIGVAHVNLDLCVVKRDEVSCGNCSRHCPVGAIRMVSVDGIKGQVPTVAEEICIGCGACENLCPSRPISAITVNGLSEHRNG